MLTSGLFWFGKFPFIWNYQFRIWINVFVQVFYSSLKSKTYETKYRLSMDNTHCSYPFLCRRDLCLITQTRLTSCCSVSQELRQYIFSICLFSFCYFTTKSFVSPRSTGPYKYCKWYMVHCMFCLI